MARFLLLPLGSYGDVHPFVGLGVELRRRGHDATLATNGYFRPICDQVGLPFVELGPREEYLEFTKRGELWNSLAGLRMVLGMVAERGLRPVFGAVERWLGDGAGVVAAGSLAFGARIARDRLGMPLATVHLQPSVPRSIEAFPRFPRAPDPRWLPRWARRWAYALGDRWTLDPLLEPPINAFRAELGLPAIRHPMRDWLHSPDRVLGLWPDWYAPRPADWPPQLVATGFPLYDERDAVPLPADLERFLAHGPPPVAFTPGSAMRQGEGFFAAAADACARSGMRGVLLTRYAEQLPARLPAGVMPCAFAPFSALLPRCAAACHHGGIGTTAQCLRAGTPQLLYDLDAFDQPDNIARLRRLGVGRSVPRRKFTGPRVAWELAALLGDPAVRAAAHASARRFDGVDGLRNAVDELEALIPGQGKPVPAG